MFGQTSLEHSGKCSLLVGGPAGRSRNLSKRHLGLSSQRGNHYKGDRKRDPERPELGKRRGNLWRKDEEKKAQADKKNETGKTAATFITAELSKSREMKTGDN